MIDEVENILKERSRNRDCDDKLQDKLVLAFDDLVKKNVIEDIKKPFLYYSTNIVQEKW